MRAGEKIPSSRHVMNVFLASGGLFTLAASLILGVNTLFLLDAGLDILQVMLVNAAFSAGQVLIEVPTGVVADTIGWKASYLLGLALPRALRDPRAGRRVPGSTVRRAVRRAHARL